MSTVKERPFYPMEFRVLRFPITKDSYECIITNLPASEFSVNDIKEIYGMRWGIIPISVLFPNDQNKIYNS